jgi:hypothetical protein
MPTLNNKDGSTNYWRGSKDIHASAQMHVVAASIAVSLKRSPIILKASAPAVPLKRR